MIKSLYTRVVLTFLVSVIGGTLISLFVTTWVFQDKLNENLRIPLLRFGQDIARIYETLPLHEADALVSGMKRSIPIIFEFTIRTAITGPTESLMERALLP